MIERAGRPIAIGTPLSGDGRIVTALSPLTHGNQLVAHYPDGQLIPVRLSHSDRGWDLALLTPQGDAPRLGLKGSREPVTAGTKLHGASYVADKRLGSSGITIKAKSTFHGCDSAELPDAFELPFAPKATDIGAPLISDQGEVVAVIARACAMTNKAGCTLAPYGAPVTAVRDFLRSAPIRRSPWVGLDVVAFDAGVVRGVRVTGISPEGPAANSGLHAGPPGVGDVVLAVDGNPIATAAAFASVIESRGPGGSARLTVLTEGQLREIVVQQPTPSNTLAPARNDRAYQSNSAGSLPPSETPTAPNPYR